MKIRKPLLIASLVAATGLVAVSTEAFFERPLRLRSQHPRLYLELQNYFRQDPAEFSAEHASTEL